MARNERGASAVEYGLLVAGIAAIIVLVLFVFGDALTDDPGDQSTQSDDSSVIPPVREGCLEGTDVLVSTSKGMLKVIRTPVCKTNGSGPEPDGVEHHCIMVSEGVGSGIMSITWKRQVELIRTPDCAPR